MPAQFASVKEGRVARMVGLQPPAHQRHVGATQGHDPLFERVGKGVMADTLTALLLQMGLSTLGGCADHEIRFGNRMYVFEVKYNTSIVTARRQIRDRQYGREHLGRGQEVVAMSLHSKTTSSWSAQRTTWSNCWEYADEALPEGGGTFRVLG